MSRRRISRRPGIAGSLVAFLTVGLLTPLFVALPAGAAPLNPSDAQLAAADAQRRSDTAALGKLAGQLAAVEGRIAGMQAALDAAVTRYTAATVAVQQALDTTARKNAALDAARTAVGQARRDAVLQIRASFTSGARSTGSTLLTSGDPNSILTAIDVRQYIAARQTSTITDLSRAQVAASNAEAAARGAAADEVRLQADAGRQRDAVIAGLRGFQSDQAVLATRRTALNAQAALAYGRLRGLRTQRAAYTAWAAEQARIKAAEARRQAAAAKAAAAAAARLRAQQQAGQQEPAVPSGSGVSDPVTPPAAGGAWGNPMHTGTYSISSCFCARWGTFHWGVDFAANYGTPMYSIGAGTVVAAGPAQGFGNWVVIDHGTGEFSVYGHMRVLAVHVGQRVTRGQLIAYVGTEGDSTGPHLHLEIRLGGINGAKIDPQVWLAQRGVYV